MRRFTFDFLPGTVLTDERPRGYRRLVRQTVIGTAARFERAATAVLDWQVQRRSGIAALSDSGDDAPPVSEGLEGIVVVPVLGVTVSAPFRVTRVLREPDRVGFAYGTLPGHPEVGEEAFLVRRVGRETVFELRALSRPAFPYSLAAPVGLLLQRRFSDRYLRAL
ncbi:MAG: DUF1990 domain-containing protein [Acidobacteria bacterium]|nr:DUF1990 domain-containing protein [Acidobacteriota bacterium]